MDALGGCERKANDGEKSVKPIVSVRGRCRWDRTAANG